MIVTYNLVYLEEVKSVAVTEWAVVSQTKRVADAYPVFISLDLDAS